MDVAPILRDENEEFMACQVQHCIGNPNVKECKALALPNAITWIKELELVNMIFELDAKGVVDAIKYSVDDFIEFRSTVRHFNYLLGQRTSLSVQFSYRQANVAVRALARAARSYTSPSVYFETPTLLYFII